jgi:hypothetical protein
MLPRPDISRSWVKEDYPISLLLLRPNSLAKLQKEESRLLVVHVYLLPDTLYTLKNK